MPLPFRLSAPPRHWADSIYRRDEFSDPTLLGSPAERRAGPDGDYHLSFAVRNIGKG